MRYKIVTTSVYRPWADDICKGLLEFGIRAEVRERRTVTPNEDDPVGEKIYRIVVPEDEHNVARRVFLSNLHKGK